MTESDPFAPDPFGAPLSTEQGMEERRRALLQAGLWYARQGIYVFPAHVAIDAAGKKRVTPCADWDQASTIDPERIAVMFAPGTQWTSICVDTGKSGRVVVDCDIQPTANGIEEYGKAELPSGVRVRTPSGGLHHWFLADPEAPVANSTGQLAPAVDVRGAGGFVFAPPSYDARGEYRWIDERPVAGNTPPFPAAARERLAQVRPRQVVPGAASAAGGLPFAQRPRDFTHEQATAFIMPHMEALETAPHGTINDTLNAAAKMIFHFVPVFMTREAATEYLVDLQRKAWVAGGGRDDGDYSAALATIESAWGSSLRDWHAQLREEGGSPFAEAAEGGQQVGEGEARLDWYGPDLSDEPAAVKIELERIAARERARELFTEHQENRRAKEQTYDSEYLTLDELESLPKPQPLIERVLSRHTYSVLRGRGGSYKSFVAIDWALCLASGHPWLGRRATPVKVLYVAAEGAYGVNDRIKAWQIHHNYKVPNEMFVLRKSAVNLFTGGRATEDLIRRVKDGGFGLVVLDTLRKVSGGAAENTSDMGAVTDNIGRIKEATLDGTILVIAHTDKSDTTVRGHSSIGDDADIIWHCQKDDDSTEFELSCVKFKDAQDGERIPLRSKTITVGPGVTSLAIDVRGTAMVVLPAEDTSARRVLDLIEERSGTGITQAQIVDELSLSKSYVSKIVNSLIKEDLIRASGYRLYVVDDSPSSFQDHNDQGNLGNSAGQGLATPEVAFDPPEASGS